jgi:excinuclease UvrABC nuclease subunit
MPTLQDFQKTIDELNTKFPRPGLTLVVGQRYDVHTQFAEGFPNCEEPGVYALIAEDEIEVLRIGKARCLGYRLGSYFRWADREQRRGIAKLPGYEKVRYIVTVSVPADRAFEVHSVEGFLLSTLKPSLNSIFESFD